MIQKYLSFNYTLSFIYICIIINFQHIWIYFCRLTFKHFHWSIHTYWNIHAYHAWPDNKCTGQMNCHQEHIQTKKNTYHLILCFLFSSYFNISFYLPLPSSGIKLAFFLLFYFLSFLISFSYWFLTLLIWNYMLCLYCTDYFRYFNMLGVP